MARTPTLDARDGKAGADGRGVLTIAFNYNAGAGARTSRRPRGSVTHAQD
jgi:hypothetical protein